LKAQTLPEREYPEEAPAPLQSKTLKTFMQFQNSPGLPKKIPPARTILVSR
jgi:hypothetical protein